MTASRDVSHLAVLCESRTPLLDKKNRGLGCISEESG
jgi:hypothetical protein